MHALVMGAKDIALPRGQVRETEPFRQLEHGLGRERGELGRQSHGEPGRAVAVCDDKRRAGDPRQHLTQCRGHVRGGGAGLIAHHDGRQRLSLPGKRERFGRFRRQGATQRNRHSHGP